MNTALPDPEPADAPIPRAEWIATFSKLTVQLWPTIGLRHASAVALSRWSRAPTADPELAAREWVNEWKNTGG